MNHRTLLITLALFGVACGGGTDVASLSTGVTGGTGGTGGTGSNTIVAGAFNARAVVDNGTTYPFQVFVPNNYDKTRKYPVILFLHGSGERGNDNQKQIGQGLGPYVAANATTFPAIVVFPQMSADEATGRVAFIRTSIASLDSVQKEFSVDPTREYLTGISLGGIQGFELIYKNRTRFAAFNPISANICGVCIFGTPTPTVQQSATTIAQSVPTLPVWQFQGSADASVPVADVRIITTVFKSVNPADQYTEFAGQPHTIWDQVYANPALWTWMFAQHR